MDTVKVRFNSCEEFLEELAARRPFDGLVRITQRFTTSEFSPAVKHVDIVATYRRDEFAAGKTTANVGGYVVELIRRIGDHWSGGGPPMERDKKVLDKANETVELLTQNCKEMGLSVGAGVIEP
jgi:hypothetical protein